MHLKVYFEPLGLKAHEELTVELAVEEQPEEVLFLWTKNHLFTLHKFLLVG